MKLKIFLFSLLAAVVSTASAQLKIGDQPTIQQKSVALDVKGSNNLQGLWLPRVSDTSITGIRSLNPPDGLVIYHPPSGKLFIRSNNAWIAYLQNAIINVTAGGLPMTGPSLTYNTGTVGTDFNIASTGNTATWNIPSASTSARGLVTTTTQTFGGDKIFNDSLRVNGGSTLNSGTVANGGLSVTGATGSISNLTLGLNSATVPDSTRDKYLSVNSAGKVTLNSVNVSSTVPVKVKTFHVEIDEAPTWLRAGTSVIYTFTLPTANLSLNSAVTVSPVKALLAGTKINWARVASATTIQISLSADTTDQKLNPGIGNEADFFITLFEF